VSIFIVIVFIILRSFGFHVVLS